MTQATLFSAATAAPETLENVLLYALGEFQSRGHTLADRELAFDRLRGAFLRAFGKFGMAEPPDEQIVEALRKIDARVTEIPRFVAKRPYRITVGKALAGDARKAFDQKQ